MTLRVAIDGRSLRSAALRGWDRYTLELVARLPQYGVEPTLLYRAGEPLWPEHVRASGCATMAIAAPRVMAWEQVALPARLLRERFDLYHAPAERGVPFVAPCPRVLTLHSLTWHSYDRLVRSGKLSGAVSDYFPHRPGFSLGAAYINAQFRAADQILTPSAFATEETVELLRLAPERVTTTPLGLPRAFEVPPLPEQELRAVLQRLRLRRPYVLYVGGYERHKNVEGLLRAAERVLAEHGDVQFVLVGTGTVPAAMQELAGRYGERIRLLANITDDLVAIYEGASVFASLSYRETFCLPALEALSRGVPVVASEWGATRDVVGAHGSLVDPRSSERAAAAILSWLRDEAPERHQMRAHAGTFIWDRCVERTVAVYRQLLARPARS